jgi:hypothetical protein
MLLGNATVVGSKDLLVNRKNTFGVLIKQSMLFTKFHQEYIIIMSSAYYFVTAYRWLG